MTRTSLRRSTAQDFGFIERVFFTTQRWIVEQLFGWRGDEFERRRLLDGHDVAKAYVVVVDGEDAGWLAFERRVNAVEIDGLYLLPEFQRRGIGTEIIEGIIAQADSELLPVRLGVAKVNPALALYERLGFEVISESEFKFDMVRLSTARQSEPQKLSLREPCLELAESFEQMRDAFLAIGEDNWSGRHALAHTDVPAWIEALHRRASGDEIPEEWVPWVPETEYWVVLNDEVVGDLGLRHPLNEHLVQLGGNIGYSTHPYHRGKGIATFALREGLKILGRRGLTEVLATCREDNTASIRVIEKCGGVRLEDSTAAGPRRRRYSIPILATNEIQMLRPEHFEAMAELWYRAQLARGGATSAPDSASTLALIRDRAALEGTWFAGTFEGERLTAIVHGMCARADDGAGKTIPGLMHLSMVAVEPDSWGKGYGRGVTEFALKRARLSGYSSVQLWTHASNGRARHLYEHLGFVESGRRKDDGLGNEIVHYVTDL